MSKEEDLSHVCFRDVGWLQGTALTPDSVLDYFALSQFYERTCNNEVLKMQARYLINQGDILSQLNKMVGIEYAVLKALPPALFIIGKLRRASPTQTFLLTAYYVLNGSIYMAPNLLSIMNCRLETSMFHLERALGYAQSFTQYDLRLHKYKIKDPSPPADTNSMEESVTSVSPEYCQGATHRLQKTIERVLQESSSPSVTLNVTAPITECKDQ